jgi:hypothetical protein
MKNSKEDVRKCTTIVKNVQGNMSMDKECMIGQVSCPRWRQMQAYHASRGRIRPFW